MKKFMSTQQFINGLAMAWLNSLETRARLVLVLVLVLRPMFGHFANGSQILYNLW
jgi:hypothetical protein